MINKYTKIFIAFMAILGTLPIAVFLEEGMHFATTKGAKSICIDFNLKINNSVQKGYMVAHTVVDHSKWDSIEEIKTWKEFQEKWVGIITDVILLCLVFTIGYMYNKL